jgi:hypothetical protein
VENPGAFEKEDPSEGLPLESRQGGEKEAVFPEFLQDNQPLTDFLLW